MRIFAEQELSRYLAAEETRITSKINSEKDDYLLNVGEEAYVQHVIDRVTVAPLLIQYDQVYVSESEEMIPAEQFPQLFNVYSGKSYPKQVITFHVPYEGTRELLRLQPGRRIMWTVGVEVTEAEFTFRVVNFRDDAAVLKQEADHTLGNIRQQHEHVTAEVEQFNATLHTKVRQAFEARKSELLKRRNVLSELALPVRKHEGASQTFAVATPKVPKPIVRRPEVQEGEFEPHPTIPNETYSEILAVCEDVGRVMERLPSTYAGKSEEDLRDHLLLYLAPRFEGSATGETFNKSGKTDILIRYKNSNVFVAECKFWSGPKGLGEALDQLLGYLTWRDSKTALIVFVQNKDFSRVTESVRKVVPEHPQYVNLLRDHQESRIEYVFALPGDPNREVRVAVLMFHLPR